MEADETGESLPTDHEVAEAPARKAAPTAQPTLWPVSICFWMTLMLAAFIYGSVFLTPKLAVWNKLRFEHQQNAARLVELDNEVEYLERVEQTLRRDPDFLRRLSENAHLINDGELIPVSGNLLFGVEEDEEQQTTTSAAAPPLQWLIDRLATERSLRSGLLAFAAVLVILAFAFLNDAGTRLVSGAGTVVRRVCSLPGGRYRISATHMAAECADQNKD